MASPCWMSISRAARLAFQQYGSTSLAAGSLLLAAHHHITIGAVNNGRSFSLDVAQCESVREEPTSKLNEDTSVSEKAESSLSPFKTPTPPLANIRRNMTNVGRFSLLSETTTNPSVPVVVMALSGKPWTAHDFAKLYEKRQVAQKHERFQYIVENNHFALPSIPGPLPVSDHLSYPQVYRNELKNIIMDALLQPMDLSKSLWQAWVATGGFVGQSGAFPASRGVGSWSSDQVESLLLFRAHHCMADGVSLGAIFGDLMDEGEQFKAKIEAGVKAFRKRKKAWWKRILFFIYYWCYGSIRAVAYQMYLYLYSTFRARKDPWKLLKQHSEGREDTVRTLSWVQVAQVDEVKKVADFYSKKHGYSKGQKVTINDIFCSCVTGAIVRLLNEHRRNTGLDLQLPYMNLVIPVHMQGGILLPGQSIGNKIGAMVSQVPAEATQDSFERLCQVHDTLWNRKRTPAAALSYLVAQYFGGTFGTILGPRLSSWLFSKAHASATVVVTNVRGPEITAHMDGRKIESTMGFLPLPPGVPIGMVVMSYNQRITLTIMAESWAVPDADRFLSWVVEEYQELLQEAEMDAKTS